MAQRCKAAKGVEKWGVFELSLRGPSRGNPFLDVQFGATFGFRNRTIDVDGFYDGDGVYRVRFMPDQLGQWSYMTRSNRKELAGASGRFVCTPPSEGNHGPVNVNRTFHFAYADGTRHYSFGTTCYAWVHQTYALEEQTLKTLRSSPFNKMRMCVFPKHYVFNANEPRFYSFVQKKPARKGKWFWDFNRFDVRFWRHFEGRVADLMALGVEADIIVFHPYDRWGFAEMDDQTDERYLRYAIARLAAFRNVWWSMANEWDFMKSKSVAKFDRYFRIVQQCDPYHRMRSIHNGSVFYDHTKQWVTHASIQRSDLSKVLDWRRQYHKPVVVDECCYEGNIDRGWGNIPAQEMVHRFWLGMVNGGYVGHGETYMHPRDILWWSKGGRLHGRSPKRIAFLRKIMEEGPSDALEPVRMGRGHDVVAKPGQYYLFYLGIRQPAVMSLELPKGARFKADVIDTWKMTITPLRGTLRGNCRVPLPGRPYMALRLRKI